MKKTMLLGMVLLTMVFGATGCGTKHTEETHTDEEIIKSMLVEDHGHENFEVEILDYNEETDEIEYLSYLDGNLSWCGTVDRSWAENVYCD